MANKGGEVRLHLDHVLLKVAAASDRALEAVALQIEAQTKVNIQQNNQIDTGFMMNSTYVVTRERNTFDQTDASGDQFNRYGELVKRRTVPPQPLPGHARAACVVGAEYAIYQEAKKPFLYPASVTVASQVKGTAEQVFKENLND